MWSVGPVLLCCGSEWRGSPATGDTLTLPAAAGPSRLRRHNCDRARPRRCNPVGRHKMNCALMLNEILVNIARISWMNWASRKITGRCYLVLLVRDFPRVSKTCCVLGQTATHCGEVIWSKDKKNADSPCDCQGNPNREMEGGQEVKLLHVGLPSALLL